MYAFAEVFENKCYGLILSRLVLCILFYVCFIFHHYKNWEVIMLKKKFFLNV
jgi:hypothetical protein